MQECVNPVGARLCMCAFIWIILCGFQCQMMTPHIPAVLKKNDSQEHHTIYIHKTFDS